MYNNLKNKTILYIEDDEVVLKNISKLLGNYFSTIHIAMDGEKGYKQFINYQEEIDLLIVDIELPKINGIELIKKIRKLDAKIPIVVISAYTKTDYLLESVELNLDKYIVKPFTSKKLHKLLEKLDAGFLGNDTFELVPNVHIDKQFSTLKVGDTTSVLTLKELEFLETLHAKNSVTYDDIDILWRDNPPTPDAIRSFIKALRKKLPKDLLKNRQNIGYFIEK
jgi:DNA-binding response OmpR family regulator